MSFKVYAVDRLFFTTLTIAGKEGAVDRLFWEVIREYNLLIVLLLGIRRGSLLTNYQIHQRNRRK